MRGVIHTVQERNLLLVSFHLHILSIDSQRPTETFPVAIVMCYLIVVRKLVQLIYNPRIRPVEPFSNSLSKCADAESFEM